MLWLQRQLPGRGVDFLKEMEDKWNVPVKNPAYAQTCDAECDIWQEMRAIQEGQHASRGVSGACRTGEQALNTFAENQHA